MRWRRTWSVAFRASDGRRRSSLVAAITTLCMRRGLRRLFAEHPADVVVSVHAAANAPALGALGRGRRGEGASSAPRFAIVVVDLVTVHALWLDPRADATFVPNEGALRRAISCGVPPETLHVAGMPIASRFATARGKREALRRELDWPLDRPMVLLVAGGEGMGDFESVARAIDAAQLGCGLAIVAGRNQEAFDRLREHAWQGATRVYGFVDTMANLMHAADVLVTKAGPNSICEALNADLPMLLYDALSGHEDGNVDFVVEGGAGLWTPDLAAIVAALRGWLAEPDALARARDSCGELARPEAAREIARGLLEV